MNSPEDNSGITELVHGDMSSARQVRDNLAAFARKVDNPEISKLVSEVLAGRRSFRDVLRTKEFNEVGMKQVTSLEKGIAALSDEERAELWDRARQGTPEETFDAVQHSHDARPPAVEKPLAPKVRRDPTDDDEDFSQRSYAE